MTFHIALASTQPTTTQHQHLNAVASFAIAAFALTLALTTSDSLAAPPCALSVALQLCIILNTPLSRRSYFIASSLAAFSDLNKQQQPPSIGYVNNRHLASHNIDRIGLYSTTMTASVPVNAVSSSTHLTVSTTSASASTISASDIQTELRHHSSNCRLNNCGCWIHTNRLRSYGISYIASTSSAHLQLS